MKNARGASRGGWLVATSARGQEVAALLRALPERWFRFLLLLPALTVMVLIMIYPLTYSFWLSLHSYDLINPVRYVGLNNYVNILGDERVWNSVRVTFNFAIPSFVLELVLGFVIALLIHYHVTRKGLWRTLLFMPLLMTPVIIGINWRVMFNYDFGVINYYLSVVGVHRQNWLSDPSLALPALITVEVWHNTPFVMLIMSAGLAALPLEPFEMAEIDGAGLLQTLWYLTIPMLKPLFLIVALFRSYELIRVFDIVFALTQGGPGRATETLSFHIFNQLFEGFQVGYSAAVSYVLFSISLTISVVLIRLIGAGGDDEGW